MAKDRYPEGISNTVSVPCVVFLTRISSSPERIPSSSSAKVPLSRQACSAGSSTVSGFSVSDSAFIPSSSVVSASKRSPCAGFAAPAIVLFSASARKEPVCSRISGAYTGSSPLSAQQPTASAPAPAIAVIFPSSMTIMPQPICPRLAPIAAAPRPPTAVRFPPPLILSLDWTVRIPSEPGSVQTSIPANPSAPST